VETEPSVSYGAGVIDHSSNRAIEEFRSVGRRSGNYLDFRVLPELPVIRLISFFTALRGWELCPKTFPFRPDVALEFLLYDFAVPRRLGEDDPSIDMLNGPLTSSCSSMGSRLREP
jgi:hypothetical protein